MTFSRVNLWVFILLGVLVFFQYRLWIGPGSIREMSQLKKQLVVEQSTNERLKKRNELVRLQVQQLQKNQDAIESRARQELGMIKKDETFYQIVK